VRFRAYELLCRAVTEGVAYGYGRAHKHDENPDEEAIKSAIDDAVMAAISEILDFEPLSDE
jgi:hypothetical protein